MPNRRHRTRAAAARVAAVIAALLAPVARAAAEEWPPAPPLAGGAESPGDRLPPSVKAVADGPGRWRCTFQFELSPRLSETPPNSVTLAGTFNGWSRDAQALRTDDGQVWTIDVSLPSGVHQYKFVVNGDRWLPDPQNAEGVDDGHQGQNSVLRLGAVAAMKVSPAARGDGRIETIGLEHSPDRPLYFQQLGRDAALVRYRTLARDVERIWLALRGAAPVEMACIDEGTLFALYEAHVAFPAPAGSSIEYAFILQDGAIRVSDPQMHKRKVSVEPGFVTPDWAKHAVWYQIMVDRFRNGDPTNDPPGVRDWRSDWFRPVPPEAADRETFYKHVHKRLYGGDIAGLQQSLPYLKALGVTALYLNPVFKAESHHKYDATNFLHIDDHFGVRGDYEAVASTENLNDPKTWKWTETDRLFLAFIQQAHAAGIRVVIDGVWNHVGVPHPAFHDVLQNGERSPFADWFDVTSWEPFEYQGWAGHDSLPVFRKSPTGLASERCKQHIFNVTRRWMDPNGDGDPSDGVDGWRLDVPNEIALPFWAEWRALVKSINPDAYTSGEIWDRAEAWLDGRHFDAVMNYEFARVAVSWACHTTSKMRAAEADRKLRELRLAYPLAATQVMMNLVDSHDTDRLVSMALNPDRGYDKDNRVQDDNPHYNNDKPEPEHYARARLVALLQMTYVGAPMIYYGDEVGMWGADDPTCRKPMLWEDLQPYEKPEQNFVMHDHLEFYRRAIALRHAHPALRTGTFTTLKADDMQDVWIFARANEQERLVVALNASHAEQTVSVPLPQSYPSAWKVVLGEPEAAVSARGELTFRLAPFTGVVALATP